MDNKKILIVDDVEMNRTFLKVSFQQNYEIFEASNGQEALSLLQDQPVDIIISDIFMDVMDGYELIERIRQDAALCQIPIIAVTENECASQVRAMRAGADYFISRPFVNPLLEETINRLITRRGLTVLDDSIMQQHALIRSTIDHIPAGILVFRIFKGTYSIIEANPAICEIMGLDPERALGADDQDILMLTYPDDIPIVKDAAKRLAAPGAKVHYEYRNFYRSKRDYVWVSGDGYSVAQPDGSVLAYISFTDITDRIKLMDAQADLLAEKKANKAKSEFLSNMSHDIRTPLNAILNLTDMAREEIADSGQLLSDLNKISVASEFLLSMVNEILDMARIENGRVELKPEVYLAQEFDEYIDSTIAPLFEKKMVAFSWAKKGQPMDIFVDRTRINQIFYNLLSNAAQYTPAGGTVKLDTIYYHPIRSHMPIDIIISDNGCGMSEGFQKKLFQPFERENNTDAFSGTGLGLAITKSIVEKMRGSISIKSKLDEGTTITVHLDLLVASAEQVHNHMQNSRNTAISKKELINAICEGKRILVVEDHPLNQEIICRLLHKHNLTTVCANNGQEGVDLFCRTEPGYFDAILMDIRMPVMNGLDATVAIRNSEKSDAATIPIIALTANAFVDDIVATEKAGMNSHLSKPIEPDLLFRTLCNWLDQEHTLAANKILVVDDVAVNAAVIAETLRSQYQVLIANDGWTALDILEKNKDILALITDIQMPGMSGYELIKTVRSKPEFDKLTILANTQFEEASQEEALLALGADDFIYKPTMPNVIRARLEKALKK